MAVGPERKYPDMQIGDRFGEVTVLESTEGMSRRRDMRIRVRCDCGNEYTVSPHSLWLGNAIRCRFCGLVVGQEKRRQEPTPVGTQLGYFVVENYEFTSMTGNGSNKERHTFTLRDTRCGHLRVIRTHYADLTTQFKGGRRTLCGCPGRNIASGGYVMWVWANPNGRGQIQVPEHRIIMEWKIGRELRADETVHHINGVRDDNRPENLQLRQGRHGTGVVMVCYDCGSHNIGHVPIAESESSA